MPTTIDVTALQHDALAVSMAPALPQDVDAMLQIEQAAYELPWSRASFMDLLAKQGTACGDYVVQLLWAQSPTGQNELQGYFVALLGFEEVHLLNLAVHPACQGRGCGWLLLQQLRSWACWYGAHTLWLEVRQSNQRAQALYRRLGFVNVNVRKNYYPMPSGKREHAITI